MVQVNFSGQIEHDIEKYESMIEMLKTGATTGEVGSSGQMIDTTAATIGHLENIVAELKALLRKAN